MTVRSPGEIVEGAVECRIVAALVGADTAGHVLHVTGDEALPAQLRLGEGDQLRAGVVAEVADGDVIAAGLGGGGEELDRLVGHLRAIDVRRQPVQARRAQAP
jgi:hypothetical protein